MDNKKLKVGWFSFTCCEDSTIILTELLNDHFFAWRELLDIRYAKVLKSKNVLDSLDVAFIEGAISSKNQAEKLKKIRAVSKKLVAVGSCAVSGFPSAQRNLFNQETTFEIKPILSRFQYLDKVARVDEVVKVDASLTGCPMDPDKFVALLSGILVEFGLKK